MKTKVLVQLALLGLVVVLVNGCDGQMRWQSHESHDNVAVVGPDGQTTIVSTNFVEHCQKDSNIKVMGPITLAKEVIKLPFEAIGEVVGCNVYVNTGYSTPVMVPVQQPEVVNYTYIYSTDDYGHRHCFKSPPNCPYFWRHDSDGVTRPYYRR